MLIETRPYFIIGDLIANAVAGAAVGGLLALIIGPGWNMFVVMIPGMAIGMVLAFPLAFLMTGLFGAMEVMLPVMTTGMVVGMAVSMLAVASDYSVLDGALLGTELGVAVLVTTYVANALIRRRTPTSTS